MKEELKMVMKEEMKMEMQEELTMVMQEELKMEMREELKMVMQEEFKMEMKEELKMEMKEELKDAELSHAKMFFFRLVSPKSNISPFKMTAAAIQHTVVYTVPKFIISLNCLAADHMSKANS